MLLKTYIDTRTNMAADIHVKRDGRFIVSLRDIDSGMVFDRKRIFSSENMAHDYARHLANIHQ